MSLISVKDKWTLLYIPQQTDDGKHCLTCIPSTKEPLLRRVDCGTELNGNSIREEDAIFIVDSWGGVIDD